MKYFVLSCFFMSVAFAQNNIPERSVSKSMLVTDLTEAHQILILEDLKVDANDELLSRETASGFGRWCYLKGSYDSPKSLKMGSMLNISGVVLEKGKKSQARWIEIQTEEGLRVECLGTFIQRLKASSVEDIFNDSIRFVKK